MTLSLLRPLLTLAAAALLFSGCTTINNTYYVSADHGSTITGSSNALATPKTVTASPYLTTTGDDIAKVASMASGIPPILSSLPTPTAAPTTVVHTTPTPNPLRRQ